MKLKYIFLGFCLLAGLICACSDRDKGMVLPDAELTLSLQKLAFSSVPSEQVVHLTSTASWEIGGIPSWLRVAPSAGKAGEGDVVFTVDRNPEQSERTAKLEVKYGGRVLFFPVRQRADGEDDTLGFEQKQFDLSEEEQTLRISYTYSTVPEVEIPDTVHWLALVSTKSVQNGIMTFKVEENTGNGFRSAEVIVRNPQAWISDTLRFVQRPFLTYKEPKQKQDFVPAAGGSKVLEVESNAPMRVEFLDGTAEFPSWMSLDSNVLKDGKSVLTFHFEPNASAANVREFSFRVVCEPLPELNFVYAFRQGFHAKDGDVVALHKRTKNPVGSSSADIVFTGDGFTQQDIEDGTFDLFVRRAYETLFDCEPYRSLKDYFSAYMVYAVSKDAGISEIYPGGGKQLDTRYNVHYNESHKNGITVDLTKVYSIVGEAVGSDFTPSGSCVVMVANDTTGPHVIEQDPRGTCVLASDKAVAICPLKRNKVSKFDHMVRHEAGGHGYGKLADEYYTFNESASLSERDRNELHSWHDQNCYWNVHDNESDLPWKDFLSYKEKYPQIGTFQGGYYVGKGVWRSTQSSIMKDENGIHHSVFCRYLIWKRVMQTFGEDTSVAGFVKQDKVDFRDEVVPIETVRRSVSPVGHQRQKSCVIWQE